MRRQSDHKRSFRRQYTTMARTTSTDRRAAAGAAEAVRRAKVKGYTDQELASVPADAVQGLGCANPVALADLRPGETVLDLGCGGGLDTFLAAQRVGPTGAVIGVDMTPAMLERAQANARAGGCRNVRFETAEIEDLPLGNATVDVVISNCVLNHCHDKVAAFREVARVLKPGGRLCVADLVARGPFSAEALQDEVWGAWLAVALDRRRYLDAIRQAGLARVRVVAEHLFAMSEADPRLAGRITSLIVRACR
jgi:SAM-dependent methyltransferase